MESSHLSSSMLAVIRNWYCTLGDEGCAFLCGLPSGDMLFLGPKVSTLSFLESSCSTMAVGLIAVLPIILVLQLAGKVKFTLQVLGRTHGG